MEARQQPGYYAWEDLAAAIRSGLDFTVTAAVGAQETELTEVHCLYKQTREILNERFYKGTGSIIHALAISNQFDSEHVPPFNRKEWFEAINQLDFEQAAQKLHQYFEGLALLRIKKKISAIGRLILSTSCWSNCINLFLRGLNGRSYIIPSIMH